MTLQGKTVLVTGATGFVGGALAQRLSADGVYVRALARSPEKGRFLRDIPNVEIVQGDITNAARMQAVTQGCDVVFHVAAATSGPLADQQRANVDGTRNVLLAAAAAKVERVVHVSTVAVYGYRVSGDITEDRPPDPGPVAYNRTKAEGERLVREIGAQHGLDYGIVRPGMVYGPRSGMWTGVLFRVARRKPTPFLGNGSGRVLPIFIDDLVDLMVIMATHPAARQETFNAAADPAPTWREFLGGYARLAGHESWLGIPVWIGRLVAPLAELAMRLGGQPQDIPALISYVTSQKTYKMTKARDRLGWQPQTSLNAGIEHCAPWLREKGLLP
jgi:nucleoside-diphosphate-sugar epimerase